MRQNSHSAIHRGVVFALTPKDNKLCMFSSPLQGNVSRDFFSFPTSGVWQNKLQFWPKRHPFLKKRGQNNSDKLLLENAAAACLVGPWLSRKALKFDFCWLSGPARGG
jgi:hypothetical protein